MEGSGNNLVLLLLGKLDEVYRIAGDTDGKLRIFLGVSLRIKKRLASEHVNVEMMAALFYVAVKKSYEIIYLILCCCHSFILSFSAIYPFFS